MIKQIALIILFSLLVVFFQTQLGYGLDFILRVYNYFSSCLQIVFSNHHFGQVMQAAVALLILPCLAGVICFFVFWMLKRRVMYSLCIVWGLWLVLVTDMIVKTGVNHRL